MKFYVIKNSLYHNCTNNWLVGFYRRYNKTLKCGYCDLEIPKHMVFGFDYMNGSECIWPIYGGTSYPKKDINFKIYEIEL